MNKLNDITPLLERLFDEADNATSPALGSFSQEDRAALTTSKTRYLELYGQLGDLWIPVSPETGRLLYTIARTMNARSIVEFGTSFGLSTLYLGAAVSDVGGGQIISTEFEPGKVARARAHIAEAGLQDLVEIRAGDALQTLAIDLPDSIDLLVLDGAKPLYADVLDLVEPRLRPGALVIADDADMAPDYVARVRSTDGWLSVAVSNGTELTIKLANKLG